MLFILCPACYREGKRVALVANAKSYTAFCTECNFELQMENAHDKEEQCTS